MIWLTEKDPEFNTLMMLKFFAYHLLQLIQPIVAIILAILVDGLHMLANLQFLNANLPSIFSNIIGFFNFIAIYFYYRMYTGMGEVAYPISYTYFVHYICMLVSRGIVVAVKYGFFSQEHFELLHDHNLSPHLLNFD